MNILDDLMNELENEENERNMNYIKDIQRGAIRFVELFKELDDWENKIPTIEEAVIGYINFAVNPSIKTLKIYKEFVNDVIESSKKDDEKSSNVNKESEDVKSSKNSKSNNENDDESHKKESDEPIEYDNNEEENKEGDDES